MKAAQTVELSVASTWDGHQVDPGEVVLVKLDSADMGLRVTVEAPFHGDPPPPGPAGPTPGLWEFEVVELFIADQPGAGESVRYLELELSPHGHHLVLRLEGIRRPVEQGLTLDYSAVIDRDSGWWQGIAIVPLEWLPAAPHRVNAFAIHGVGASRRYLAWSPLPGEEANFHQPHRFPLVRLPVGG